MVDIKELLLIDVLKFIPGEARDLLRIALRIAIDLPEGLYIFLNFIYRLHQSQMFDGLARVA